MSSHTIRIHLEDYRNAETVKRARKVVSAYKGVADQWSARGQWEFWAAVEPEFGEDYPGLLKALAKAGIPARLLDPVHLVFATDAKEGDPAKVAAAFRKHASKYLHAPHLDPERGEFTSYLGWKEAGSWASKAKEQASFEENVRAVESALKELGAKSRPRLVSHEWIRFRLKDIDCRDCAYDLEVDLSRLDGLVLARVELERHPSPRGTVRALVTAGGAHQGRIAALIRRSGFVFELVKETKTDSPPEAGTTMRLERRAQTTGRRSESRLSPRLVPISRR